MDPTIAASLAVVAQDGLLAVAADVIHPRTVRIFEANADPLRQLRRIGHKLVDSGDGRVFAIGGADSGDLRNTIGTARDCGELFDPGSFQWTSFAECGTTGEGYGLAVASRPDHGALVVTGLGEGSTDNGTYGWLGFGPPLLPAE